MLFRKQIPSRWTRYSTAVTLFTAIALIAPLATYYAFYRRHTTVAFTASDGTTAVMNIDSFRQVELLDVGTNSWTRPPLDRSGYTMIVILSAGDCPTMLKERETWSQLVNQYREEDLSLVGVLVRSSVSEARTFMKGFDLPFTLLLDERNELRGLTPIPSITPFKVLVKDGQIVASEGPRGRLEGETFADKVRSITRGSSSP